MDARRLLPVGIAVTVLLVVAGIASHGRPLRPGVGVGPSATFFDYVATTSLLFAILLAAVFLYALRTERTNKARPRSRFNIVSFVLMIAASVLIASLLASSKFEKRFRAAVGASPRKFASIVRLKNVLQQYPTADSLTGLGYEAGFYDQAHFIKEFKAFTGDTPEDFFRKQ